MYHGTPLQPTSASTMLTAVMAHAAQGLAVHGRGGAQLSDAQLPADVVAQAFKYSEQRNVPLVAFLGDHCAALRMTPELEELHWR